MGSWRRILTPYCLREGVALVPDLSASRVELGPLLRHPQAPRPAFAFVSAPLEAPHPSSGHRCAPRLRIQTRTPRWRSSPARPSETGSEIGGVRGVSGAAEAGLPLSHCRVEAPLPVRPAGCFRPEGVRVVPGLRVTLPAVAPERGRWGSRPEGPGTQPWRPWSLGPGRGPGSPRTPGRGPGAVLCGQVPRLRPRPPSWSAFGRASYSPRPNDNKAQPFPPRI